MEAKKENSLKSNLEIKNPEISTLIVNYEK